MTEEEFLGPRYLRLRHIKELMARGAIDKDHPLDRAALSARSGQRRGRMSSGACELAPIIFTAQVVINGSHNGALSVMWSGNCGASI